MQFSVLYEDADVFVVDKPTGVLTHASTKAEGENVADWFKKKYPEGDYAHRLDRDTSGALVFAKNQNALEFLRKAFTDRLVKKTYLALVHGTLKDTKGVIDFDIGRSRKDFRLRSAQPKAKGRLREAVTRYEVLGGDSAYSLLKLSPETGRTHQIRVHLKAIHHPIVGDALYAPNHADPLALGRLALHAYEIDLPLPLGGRAVVTAPLPSGLAKAFSKFASL